MALEEPAQVPPGYIRGHQVEPALVLDLLLRLVNHVHDPGSHGFNQHLRAFFFQELEHVEIAVAFRRLRPEFTCNLYGGLHAGTIHRNGVEALAHFVQCRRVVIAIELVEKLADQSRRARKRGLADELAELAFQGVRLFAPHHFLEQVHALIEHPVGLPSIHFEGADLVGNIIDDVPDVHGVQDAQKEVEIHFQTGFRFGLIQAAALLEKKHTESIKPRVTQRQAILSFVHAKPAGSAGARCKEHVTIDDFLLGHTLLFQVLQVLHQIAHREIGGIALPVVAVFLAELERLLVGNGKRFALIAQAFERAVNQLLVFPGQPSKQNRGLLALRLGERMLHRPLKTLCALTLDPGFFLQPFSFFLEPLADQVLL